jgi:30S ribosomal protein S31
MGRGDKRTAKGKRFRSSHGNSRPAGKVVVKAAAATAKAKKTVKKA